MPLIVDILDSQCHSLFVFQLFGIKKKKLNIEKKKNLCIFDVNYPYIRISFVHLKIFCIKKMKRSTSDI